MCEKFHCRNDNKIKYSWISIKAVNAKSFLWRYTGMYTDLLSQCFENTALGCLDMVQCTFFCDTNQTHVCCNISKVSGFLAVLREYVSYNVVRVKVRKISEFFWVEMYCKMSDMNEYGNVL